MMRRNRFDDSRDCDCRDNNDRNNGHRNDCRDNNERNNDHRNDCRDNNDRNNNHRNDCRDINDRNNDHRNDCRDNNDRNNKHRNDCGDSNGRYNEHRNDCRDNNDRNNNHRNDCRDNNDRNNDHRNHDDCRDNDCRNNNGRDFDLEDRYSRWDFNQRDTSPDGNCEYNGSSHNGQGYDESPKDGYGCNESPGDQYESNNSNSPWNESQDDNGMDEMMRQTEDRLYTVPVFLSRPNTLNATQEAFIRRLIHEIRRELLFPRTLPRTEQYPETVLENVRRVVNSSYGLIATDLKQLEVDVLGTNIRRFPNPMREWLGSEFLQIEPAMAFQRGLPLLLIREKGVQQTGLWSPGIAPFLIFLEWDPERPLDEFFISNQWRDVLKNWASEVRNGYYNQTDPEFKYKS